MLEKLKESINNSKKSFNKAKVTVQVKSLINQLSNEIESYMDSGDWDTAVRLAYYRHEFSKTYNRLDWYAPYIELRKVRDHINILIGK